MVTTVHIPAPRSGQPAADSHQVPSTIPSNDAPDTTGDIVATVLKSTVLPSTVPENEDDAPSRRLLRRLRSIRAWMLVLPVDALMLVVPVLWAPDQWKATLITATLALVLFTNGGRYRARLHLAVMDELPGLWRNVLAAAAIVAIFVALRHESDRLMDFLTQTLIVMGLVSAGRIVTTAVINASRRHKVTRHRTVLAGGGTVAAELAQTLAERPRYGLAVMGYIDPGNGMVDGALAPRLGGLGDLADVVRRTGADVLLIADGDLDERDVLAAIESPGCESCDLLIVPRMHFLRTHGARDDTIGSIPVMRIGQANLAGPAAFLKRATDVLVSGTMLVLLSPVLALFALAVRLDGGPGVIFRQPRIGRNGEVFDCLKLRSMRPANAEESSTNWSIAGDKRVSPLGKLLRRTSIDELPQLWNVLIGDMSLVGPRPERPFFVEQFSAQYDKYARRHRVRTGLTGLAQVSGLRGNTSIAERARYDNFYIENWSLWLDIKIMLRTFSEVLFARGR